MYFERNCGATADYAAHIIVKRAGIMQRHRDTVVVLAGQPEVKLEWRGPHRLIIKHEPARAFQRKNVADVVRIEYEVLHR